ncbi:MAG TPA: hypothetical protein VMV69_28265 [Pirellulales bacterium]|nr:hypothetical protein [Pirellulales bacterium]
MFSDLLDAAALARSSRGDDDGAPASEPVRASAPIDRDEPNYGSVVFDVVTPSAWQRLVEAATSQARSGDPRAREWVANVLGADSAIDELARELDAAYAARSDVMGYSEVVFFRFAAVLFFARPLLRNERAFSGK